MLKLENVSKYYHSDNIVTLGLNKINLTFNSGEFVAITGESGSGKSTLLNVISGIDSYEDGEFYINGEETSHYDNSDWESYRRDYIGFIFQNYNLIDSYTVLKNVEVAMVCIGAEKTEVRRRALEIIEKVGLISHVKHRASKLSGGQKQRLAIARAIAKNSPIIVADEPTGNLDSESGKQVLELLNEVAKEKLVIIVTHNYDQVASYVSRKIRLFDGQVVEDKIIKETNNYELKVKQESKISNIDKIATVSFFNIFGQPRRSFFLFLVTLFSIFFIFMIYSYFNNIITDGQNNVGYYSNNLNSYKERLIVVRKDRLPMEDNDYQYFSKLRDVDEVIKESLVLDLNINMFFQNDAQRYSQQGFINLSLPKDKVIGRLPENDNEIFISLYADQKEYMNYLNKQMEVNIMSFDFQYHKKYTLVGIEFIESYRQPSYKFTNQEIRVLYDTIKISKEKYVLKEKNNYVENFHFFRTILLDKNLHDNQIRSRYPKETEETKYYLKDIEVQLIYDSTILDTDTIYVSENIYNNLLSEKDYQYTLNLNNYQDKDLVMDKLYKNGYYALSPYEAMLGYNGGDVIGDLILKILMNIFKYFVIFVIYLITYRILKTILSSKVKDYTILRTIGFEQIRIKEIIRFEIIFIFLVAYLFDIILFFVLNHFYPKIFINVISTMKLSDLLLLTITYLIISLLTSRKFIRMLDKKSLLNNLKLE